MILFSKSVSYTYHKDRFENQSNRP